MVRDADHKRMRASVLIVATLHSVDAHHIRKIDVRNPAGGDACAVRLTAQPPAQEASRGAATPLHADALTGVTIESNPPLRRILNVSVNDARVARSSSSERQ